MSPVGWWPSAFNDRAFSRAMRQSAQNETGFRGQWLLTLTQRDRPQIEVP
jgi:hypothetical protein